MSYIVVIDRIEVDSADKIAKWKTDRDLSMLIMSEYQKTSVSSAKEWIIKNSTDTNQVLNGIYLIADNSKELIGISRLMFIDYESMICELGIYIGEDKYRGHGLGEKALDLTINLAFEKVKLKKIFLRVNKNNTIAIKLYKKKGFLIEGVLKEHLKNGNSYDDILYMSIFNRNSK
jgi:RimJ/RimL family protein N-acetyltransferase